MAEIDLTQFEGHTPGPWRWELSSSGKAVHVVGGTPRYDLTVMDFARWGMASATPRFRDVAHDGMNIMHRLPDVADWIRPFSGREHHASWCAETTHPDARLIAAAPDLLAEVIRLRAEVAALKGGAA